MIDASDNSQSPDSDDRLMEAPRRQLLGDESGPPPPAGETTETVPPGATAKTPKRIGQYHIKRAIASGGMGTVYEAVQEKPRRVVAVKLMKQGIASRSAMRRFEYESQILARLRHPGIAQVYEAGTHRDESGTVPFFAMEYIVGAEPITKYAKEKKLGTHERMTLFAQVCDAIHHGHQKGIIHRDLKPSNILVDAAGQVKIIDFGVARSTDSDLAVTTLQTDIGQLIGTLQYMSPEQCKADPHEIDTRSDVYALGVVFYELLCGRLPYNVKRMAMHEATRIIREELPTKLSTINRRLRGDVETIALKALEKDRERRYQSATDFAQDIRRYLAGEAITARPPSIVYQLRVFARRNRAAFAAVATVFVVLVAASIVSTSLYLRADRARADAVAAQTAEAEQRKIAEAHEQLARQREQEAVTARDAEAEQRRIAEANATRAEQVATLMKDMLRSVGPGVAKGRDTTLLREILDHTADRLDREPKDQPAVEADLRNTIGWTYFDLGQHRAAESMFRKALSLGRSIHEGDHWEVAASLLGLAHILVESGSRDEAEVESVLREALSMHKRLYGEGDRATALCMVDLGRALYAWRRLDEAETLCRKAIEMEERVLGGAEPLTLGVLGNILTDKGNVAESEAFFRRSVAAYRNKKPGTWRLAGGLCSLANFLRDKREFDEAEALYREALEIAQRVIRPDHAGMMWPVIGLTTLLQARGDNAAAATVLENHLDASRRELSEGNPAVTVAVRVLAWCYIESSRFDQVETLWNQHLDKCRDELGEDDPAMIAAVNAAGTFYFQTARHDLAEPLLREVCEKRKRVLGEEHTDTLDSLETWLLTLNAQGKTVEARRRAAELIDLRQRRIESPDAKANDYDEYAWLLLNIEPSDLRDAEAALPAAERAVELSERKDTNSLDTLAVAYEMTGDVDKAIETQRETLAMLPQKWSTTRAELQDRLARFLEKKGKPDAAEQVWRDSVDWLREHAPGDHGGLVSALIYLGRILNGHDKFAEAEPVLRECLELRRKALPPEHWLIANAMSSLGESLAGQGRFAEAEPLLLDAYEQLEQKALTINYRARPDRLREGLDRIIALYESWGKPDKTAEYRALLSQDVDSEAAPAAGP